VERIVAVLVDKVSAGMGVEHELADHVAVLVEGAGEHERCTTAGIEEALCDICARDQLGVDFVHFGAVVDQQLHTLQIGAHTGVV